MKIPYFKAIDKDTGKEVQGFYFKYPKTTYCFTNDYEKNKVELIPCLMSYRMTDWGLPNTPIICQNIDKNTLQQIGHIDTNENFFLPTKWIKNSLL